jgi:hypothetical protein
MAYCVVWNLILTLFSAKNLRYYFIVMAIRTRFHCFCWASVPKNSRSVLGLLCSGLETNKIDAQNVVPAAVRSQHNANYVHIPTGSIAMMALAECFRSILSYGVNVRNLTEQQVHVVKSINKYIRTT